MAWILIQLLLERKSWLVNLLSGNKSTRKLENQNTSQLEKYELGKNYKKR